MNGTSVANRCNDQMLQLEQARSVSCITQVILANFINSAKTVKKP